MMPEMKQPARVTCPSCHGTGATDGPFEARFECLRCEGRGTIPNPALIALLAAPQPQGVTITLPEITEGLVLETMRLISAHEGNQWGENLDPLLAETVIRSFTPQITKARWMMTCFLQAAAALDAAQPGAEGVAA